MNFVLMLYVVWTLVVIWYGWSYTVKNRDREAYLEDYAYRLEEWELSFKVRKVALDGLLMYARRLSFKRDDEDSLMYPLLSMNMQVLEDELFGEDETG